MLEDQSSFYFSNPDGSNDTELIYNGNGNFVSRNGFSDKYMSDEIAPPGWMVMGSKKLNNTIASVLDLGIWWVRPAIVKVMKAMKDEFKQQDLLPQEWPLLEREFRWHRMFATYYSPEVIERLIEYKEIQMRIPKGWRSIGKIGKQGSISDIVGITGSKIDLMIPFVLRNLDENFETNNIPLPDRPPLRDVYFNEVACLSTYYSPIVIDALKAFISERMKVPQAWMPIGDKTLINTISNLLDVQPNWLTDHIEQCISQLRSRGVFNDKDLSDIFLNGNFDLEHYYSPIVIEELKRIYNQEFEIPPDWICLRSQNKYSDILSEFEMHPTIIIREYLPRVIRLMQRRREEAESIGPVENTYCKKIKDQKGEVSIFCAPQVFEELKRWIISKSSVPGDWHIIGQPWVQNTLANILKVDRVWVAVQIKRIIEQDSEGLTSDSHEEIGLGLEKYFDVFISGSGKLEHYYSPYILQELQSRRRNY